LSWEPVGVPRVWGVGVWSARGRVLLTIVARLGDLGHTAHEAHSGREALDILRAPPVDLVVTESGGPRMSGLRLVRIAAEWPHLPTTLVSGYAEPPSEAYSAVNRLAKPFRQEQLAQAIADALRTTAPAWRRTRHPSNR
jgi:CheY-like chemotaxis protein